MTQSTPNDAAQAAQVEAESTAANTISDLLSNIASLESQVAERDETIDGLNALLAQTKQSMAMKARKDVQEIELQTKCQAAELERDRLKNWSENLQQQVYELQSRAMALALQVKRLETASSHAQHKHQPHTSPQQFTNKVIAFLSERKASTQITLQINELEYQIELLKEREQEMMEEHSAAVQEHEALLQAVRQTFSEGVDAIRQIAE